jgi:hypothetical protein
MDWPGPLFFGSRVYSRRMIFRRLQWLLMSLGLCFLTEGGLAEDCRDSQVCLYERANDLLVLQANYLFSKAREVSGLGGSGKGAVYRELGKFCEVGGDPQKGLKKLSEKECAENYLLMAKKGLRSIRSSIANNENSIHQLASPSEVSLRVDSTKGGMPQDGRPPSVKEIPQDWRETLDTRSPFIPELAVLDPILKKLDDLQRTRSLTRAGRKELDQELMDWWDSFPKCPDKDEYIQVDWVERFPKNPTGERIRKVRLKPDGTVAHDEKALAEGMRACQVKRADWMKSGPVASSPAENGPGWLGKEPTSLSLRIFEEAQQRLADCASGKAQKQAPSAKAFALCAPPSKPSGKSYRSLQLSDAEFKKAESELDRLLDE